MSFRSSHVVQTSGLKEKAREDNLELTPSLLIIEIIVWYGAESYYLSPTMLLIFGASASRISPRNTSLRAQFKGVLPELKEGFSTFSISIIAKKRYSTR